MLLYKYILYIYVLCGEIISMYYVIWLNNHYNISNKLECKYNLDGLHNGVWRHILTCYKHYRNTLYVLSIFYILMRTPRISRSLEDILAHFWRYLIQKVCYDSWYTFIIHELLTTISTSRNSEALVFWFA